MSQLKREIIQLETDSLHFDPHNPRPVSYTHLDVYKRQQSTFLAWLIGLGTPIGPTRAYSEVPT